MTGATLDAGALIALERGSRKMIALLQMAADKSVRLAIPAGVVAQAWRGHPRQARLARLLRASVTEVIPLDELSARAVGVLCGRSGTSDVVDASVVLCARERNHTVVTSDLEDLRRIDKSLPLVSPD